MHAFLLAIALAGVTGGHSTATATAPAPAPKHIDVDDDEVVEGTRQNPDGEALLAKKRTQFGTLIKLREDFRRELLRSGE